MFEPGCKLETFCLFQSWYCLLPGERKGKESLPGERKVSGERSKVVETVTSLCSLVNAWRSLFFEAEVTIHDRADKIF